MKHARDTEFEDNGGPEKASPSGPGKAEGETYEKARAGDKSDPNIGENGSGDKGFPDPLDVFKDDAYALPSGEEMYRRACVAALKTGRPIFIAPPGKKETRLQDWPNMGSSDQKTLRYMWTAEWAEAAYMGPEWAGASSAQRDAMRCTRDARIAAVMAKEPGKLIPYNICVLMGDDTLAIDVDRKIGPAAQASLDELHAEGLPRVTLEVRTVTDGSHLYCRKNPAMPLTNRTGKAMWKPGIEVKAERGYVVGFGSVIRGKGEYKLAQDVAIVEIPLHLIEDMLDTARARGEGRPPVVETDEYDDEWAREWTADLLRSSTAVEGQRNDELRTFYYRARARGVTHTTYHDLVLDHWPPLDTLDAEKQDTYLKQIESMARWADGHGLEVGCAHPKYKALRGVERLAESDAALNSDAFAMDDEQREAFEKADRERSKKRPANDNAASGFYDELGEDHGEYFEPARKGAGHNAEPGAGVDWRPLGTQEERAEARGEAGQRNDDPNDDGEAEDAADFPAVAKPYFMKGYLTLGETSNWFGPAGQGKSASLLTIGLMGAAGRPVAGVRTRPGLVVYLAYERAEETKRRISAAYRTLGLPAGIPFVLLKKPPYLTSKETAEKLLRIIRKHEARRGMRAALIISDTLTASTAGKDLDSGKDMAEVANHITYVRDALGAHFAYIHHPTKKDANNPRGSGVGVANDDKVFSLNKGKIANIKTNTAKSPELQFELKGVHLGDDDEGDPITAVFSSIKPGRVGVENAFDEGVPERLKAAYDALKAVANERPDGVVSTNDWFDRIDSDVTAAKLKKPSPATKKRYRDELVAGDFVMSEGTGFWSLVA